MCRDRFTGIEPGLRGVDSPSQIPLKPPMVDPIEYIKGREIGTRNPSRLARATVRIRLTVGRIPRFAGAPIPYCSQSTK